MPQTQSKVTCNGKMETQWNFAKKWKVWIDRNKVCSVVYWRQVSHCRAFFRTYCTKPAFVMSFSGLTRWSCPSSCPCVLTIQSHPLSCLFVLTVWSWPLSCLFHVSYKASHHHVSVYVSPHVRYLPYKVGHHHHSCLFLYLPDKVSYRCLSAPALWGQFCLFQLPFQHQQFKSAAIPRSFCRFRLQRHLSQNLRSRRPVTVTPDLLFLMFPWPQYCAWPPRCMRHQPC